jgi:sugar porter (SP) family MFS transporter
MEEGKNEDSDKAAAKNRNFYDKPGLTKTLLRATFFSSVGGLLFGYDLGVISGALPQIAAAFNLNESQQESVVSFLYIGGIFGAILGGYICDFYGRKSAILFTDIIFAWGGLILYFSQSYAVILCGRLLVGFAVAVSGCADVSYLSEISPLPLRGSIVSVNEVCITLGFLLAYVSGYGFTTLDPYDGWRYMFGISSFVAVIQFIGMIFLPESPVWLATQNKVEEARNSLLRIYEFASFDELNNHYKADFQHIMGSEETEQGIPTKSLQEKVVKEDIKNWQPLFRQCIIAVFLSVAQQFCGHSNVLNFAPIIFAGAGMGQQSSLASTILLGIVKVLVTTFVIWKIDVVGRRRLLIFGVCLMEMSLLCMILAFQGQHTDPSTNETTFVNGGIVIFLAVTGAIGMATGYAISFGPLTWLITSEIFPSSLRGRALGASTVLNNICASFVSYTFLSVSTYFGTTAAPFVIYSLITLVTLLFAIVAIPDTGFKSPTDIHKDIQQMPFWTCLERISFHFCPGNAAGNSVVEHTLMEKSDFKAPLI